MGGVRSRRIGSGLDLVVGVVGPLNGSREDEPSVCDERRRTERITLVARDGDRVERDK